jgi:outer membrane lipoprotein-sorting protein
MKKKTIILGVLSLIFISGCLGGTPTERQNINQTMESVISNSEENMSNYSGTLSIGSTTYDFKFEGDRKIINSTYDNTNNTIYSDRNSTKVRVERGDNINYRNGTLNIESVYGLMYDNFENISINATLEDSRYTGTYYINNTTGEINMELDSGVLRYLHLSNTSETEEVELDINKIGDVEVNKPEWVSEENENNTEQSNPQVRGEVSISQSENSVSITLLSIDGGNTAIVDSTSDTLDYPEGNRVTEGGSIRVENVTTGDIIIIQGISDNGERDTLRVYNAK